ncbi:MAG: hypothetical protein Q8M92_08215 [Candidatus Subteraquimicrobiales bacterium]|nr:hypothetical protein [Candidatus Subteraquimicrobiales bacterium]
MPLEQKENIVKSYFETVIMGFLANDIRTLLNPDLDDIKQGGCSAPLAMIVFSGMNQLGYLTSSKETDAIAKEARTEECIKEFCNDWMGKVDSKTYRKSTIQDIMVSFFRHGLAHQFISIALSAITRDSKQKTLISVHTNVDGSKLYVLQVKILAQDFLKALDLVDQKIRTAEANDPGFLIRFYKRLSDQRQRHLKNNDSLFQKADKNIVTVLDDTELCTTTTSVSTCISGEASITIDRSFDFSK